MPENWGNHETNFMIASESKEGDIFMSKYMSQEVKTIFNSYKHLKYILVCLPLLGACFFMSVSGCSKGGTSNRGPLFPPTLEVLTPPTLEGTSEAIEISSIEVVEGNDLILTFPDNASRHYRLIEDTYPDNVIDVIVKDQSQNPLDELPSPTKQGAIYFYPQELTDAHGSKIIRDSLRDNCIRLFGKVYCPVDRISPKDN